MSQEIEIRFSNNDDGVIAIKFGEEDYRFYKELKVQEDIKSKCEIIFVKKPTLIYTEEVAK